MEEKQNLATQHPDIANRLREKLKTWCDQLDPPGLTNGRMSETWEEYFDHCLDGKKSPAPQARAREARARAKASAASDTSWIARNGVLSQQDGNLTLTPAAEAKRKAPFLTRSGLNIAGPATAKLTLKTSTTGPAAIAWRGAGDKDFHPANRVDFAVTAADDFMTHEVAIPAQTNIIHLRIHLPAGVSQIGEIKLEPAAK